LIQRKENETGTKKDGRKAVLLFSAP